MKTITHVAIKYKGEVHSLPAPNRHHNVIWMLCKKFPEEDNFNQIGNTQGFLDSEGNFLDRYDALEVARAAGQIKDVRNIRADRLFSEDVW